jgi:Zn-dependent protease with chaperone function
MTVSLALLGYAACVAWSAPALLGPLTRRGASARGGLAVWLTAMASVLGAAAAAVALAVRTAVADWPGLTQALCRSVAGGACTPSVYRSLLYQAGVAVLAVLLLLASAVALGRYTVRVRRWRTRTRAHARTALLVGRAIEGPRPARGARTVVLDDPRPAAYCVAGRPPAIVVTAGALAVLDRPQLRAVLAHERAHLAHGHHALATVTRGLAAVLPAVPLFAQGAAEVARLTEMAADDSAARTSGRPALIAALLAIATGAAFPAPGPAVPAAIPEAALPAAAHAVPDRVERLLRPAGPARAAAVSATLALACAVLAATPPALALLLAR